MTRFDFSQVDVFSTVPFGGNPVAVVHNAEGLSDEQLAKFANWTNLSETTFLLPPVDPAADYRVRIFTPAIELPFAGHPTLGSAHAWLAAGGVPKSDSAIVQECGIGLVPVRRHEGRLAFAAPGLLRSGPVDDADLLSVLDALGLGRDEVVDAEWVDNGPGWLGLLLPTTEAVLALTPSPTLAVNVGVVAPTPAGAETDFEVRAFAGPAGVPEDPVTGSLNAGLAQWLLRTGRAPATYVASQGTAMGRSGRIHVEQERDRIWVGGASYTRISGIVDF